MNFVPIKVDTVSTLPAVEFNTPTEERQFFVTDSGQTLVAPGADNHQSSKAAAVYVGSADYYTDSGVANAYVLEPIPPLLAPPAYRTGQRARFIAGNSNTTSSTANIGGVGVTVMRDVVGNDLVANAIVKGQQYELQYVSGSPNQLRIINSSAVKLKHESRNLLINPDFEIAQRRKTAVFNNSEGFVCDRWISRSGGGGIATCSREPVTVGDKLPGESGNFSDAFFDRHDQTTQSNAGLFPALLQRVENVRAGDNVAVTISFYARINSGSTTITPVVTQRFDSATPDVVITGAAISGLTASFVRYEQTLLLPPLPGASPLGALNNVEVSFQFDQGFTFQIDFRRCQWDYGMYATDFARREFKEELELCQRFYEKSYAVDIDPGTITFNNSFSFAGAGTQNLTNNTNSIIYNTRKFTQATVAIISPQTGASSQIVNRSDLSDMPSVVVDPLDSNGFAFRPTGGTDINNTSGTLHFTAEAEL